MLEAAEYYQGTTSVYGPCAKYTLGSEDRGDISPFGYSEHATGEDALFSTTPEQGFHLEALIVDGESLGARQLDYLFQDVEEAHTIEAVFGEGELPIVEIATNATGEGTTNLGGDIRFHAGEDVTVTFLPNDGYRVEEVIIDGVSIGLASEYSWTEVDDDHQVDVSFVPVMLGDVDGNGVVEIEDALMIAQFCVGNTPAVFIEENADVDCNGIIDETDADLVAQYYVELIDGFSC
jgi:hypothetical protein